MGTVEVWPLSGSQTPNRRFMQDSGYMYMYIITMESEA